MKSTQLSANLSRLTAVDAASEKYRESDHPPYGDDELQVGVLLPELPQGGEVLFVAAGSSRSRVNVSGSIRAKA